MNGRRPRVLVVGGDPGWVRSLRAALEAAPAGGFEAAVAGSLADARGQAAGGGVDLAVLDPELPDSAGLGSLTGLRSAAPDLPVVVVAGRDDEARALAFLRAGAQDYLAEGRAAPEVIARALRYAAERARAYRASPASEAPFRGLLANFPHGSVTVFDRDFRLILAGGRGYRQQGRDPDRLVGRTLGDLFPADKVAYVLPYYRRAFDGETVEFELALRDRVFAVSASPLDDRPGPAERIIAVARDITHRRRAEARLAEAQRVARLGSWEWAPQRGSLIWSDELYRILGYAPGEIAPSVEAFLARMHPEDRATRPGPAARLRRGVSPYEDEYRAVLPDGSIRHLRSRGEIRDGERLVGTIQDVTERVEAEAARRESEELFGIAFRNSPLAISIARLEDGRILDANEAFGRLVGCAREALIGRTSTEIGMVIDPADRRRLIERLGVEPALRDQDMPFRAASGEIRLARAAYSLIRVGGEACILFMGSDITDARRLEERAEAQARALALLKERERIEMELHDGVVQSLYAVGLGLLRWEQSPEADRTALRSAIGEARSQLDRVIRDIRAYIRDLPGRRLESEGLAAQLSGLARELAVPPELRLEFAVPAQVAEETEGALAPDGAAAIVQVAREALSNVVRHAGARAAAVELERSGDLLVLSVRDDGDGFDPAAGARNGGDGLRNMKARARALGGRVEIASRPGRGTRVRLEVPLAPVRSLRR